MVKIGIMICDRNRKCTGNKCFKSINERDGAFSEVPEFAPADMKKYGAEVIHLATCYLAGYPACPYIQDHINYIENVVGLPVVVGTHPMPQNYVDAHEAMGDWDRDNVKKYLKSLVKDQKASEKYDSTRPDFLKAAREV